MRFCSECKELRSRRLREQVRREIEARESLASHHQLLSSLTKMQFGQVFIANRVICSLPGAGISEGKSASTLPCRSSSARLRPRVPTSIATGRSKHIAKLHLANLPSLPHPANRSRRNDNSDIPSSLQLASPLRRDRFRSRKEEKTTEEAVEKTS